MSKQTVLFLCAIFPVCFVLIYWREAVTCKPQICRRPKKRTNDVEKKNPISFCWNAKKEFRIKVWLCFCSVMFFFVFSRNVKGGLTDWMVVTLNFKVTKLLSVACHLHRVALKPTKWVNNCSENRSDLSISFQSFVIQKYAANSTKMLSLIYKCGTYSFLITFIFCHFEWILI